MHEERDGNGCVCVFVIAMSSYIIRADELGKAGVACCTCVLNREYVIFIFMLVCVCFSHDVLSGFHVLLMHMLASITLMFKPLMFVPVLFVGLCVHAAVSL